MIAGLRIVILVILLSGLALSLVPVQYLFIKARMGWQRKLPRLFHRAVARLLGFRIDVQGEIVENRPLLLVANHVSWSDIIILSCVADICFIAKSEVRKWPVFGLFAVLQRTVFIEREKRGNSGQQVADIAERMAAGDAMVLFPEGTTSNGNRLLPFKSALFGATHAAIRTAGAEAVTVQPVAIAYIGLHGLPMGRYNRPVVSWPGDVALLPHLKNVLKEGAIDVEIRFGESMEVTAVTNRKDVSRAMERRVRTMLQSALMGREITDDE